MTRDRLSVGLAGLAITFLWAPWVWCQSTSEGQPKPELEIRVVDAGPEYLWGAAYKRAIIIDVVDADGEGVPGAKIEASITGGTVGFCDADTCGRVFMGVESKIDVTTDEHGRAVLGLDLRGLPDPLRSEYFSVEIKERRDDDQATPRTLVLKAIPGYEGTFLSDVVASEFFLGATFGLQYNEAGESEGFGESAALARLSVDTMWGYERPWALHTRLELTANEIPSKKADGGTKSNDDDTLVKYADAFRGSLSIYWFPGWDWVAHYKPTSRLKGHPFDAFRFGLVGRFGIITRDTTGVDGDSVIHHFQTGVSFTHHQTRAENAEVDDVNVFPMRFAEIKVGRYEEFAGVEDSTRLIFDGGIRLASAAKGAIPFYVGLHVNAGDGADDIRIFAGFLFQLDKLAEFFR